MFHHHFLPRSTLTTRDGVYKNPVAMPLSWPLPADYNVIEALHDSLRNALNGNTVPPSSPGSSNLIIGCVDMSNHDDLPSHTSTGRNSIDQNGQTPVGMPTFWPRKDSFADHNVTNTPYDSSFNVPNDNTVGLSSALPSNEPRVSIDPTMRVAHPSDGQASSINVANVALPHEDTNSHHTIPPVSTRAQAISSSPNPNSGSSSEALPPSQQQTTPRLETPATKFKILPSSLFAEELNGLFPPLPFGFDFDLSGTEKDETSSMFASH